jgi:hypothetical protein
MINVSSSGSIDQYFQVTGISGNISIWAENIPLRIEPNMIYIDSNGSSQWIKLTIYGDESLGDIDFDGTIDFLPVTNDAVAFGIKVLTVVHQFTSISQPVFTPIPTVSSAVVATNDYDIHKKSNNYNFIWIIFGCMSFIFIIMSCIYVYKRAKIID